MNSLHPVQSQILLSLQYVDSHRFNQLKPVDMTSDHFNFHIKKLQELGYVIKNAQGDYLLTNEGKATANFLDKDKLDGSEHERPKLSLLFVVRKLSNNQYTYAVQRRAKRPFNDHLVFPTWRVKWGEKITDHSQEYLKKLTGLNGTPQVIGLIRRIDKNHQTKTTLYDVILTICVVDDATGELGPDPVGAQQFWVTKEEMLSDEKLTGIPPHVFTMLEDPLSPRLVELEFNIEQEQF